MSAAPVSGDEPIELLELVSLEVTGPAVLFVRVAPELFGDEVYIHNISLALSHVLTFLKPKGIQFLIVPKDVDMAIAGEGYLTKLGYAKLPGAGVGEAIVEEAVDRVTRRVRR